MRPIPKKTGLSDEVRKLGARKDVSYESYRTCFDTRPPEVAANILICLIHQTNYLLDQLLRQLEQAFLKEGGLRERMTRARLSERAKHNPPMKGGATLRFIDTALYDW
jgi:four helix bundle suffix protein